MPGSQLTEGQGDRAVVPVDLETYRLRWRGHRAADLRTRPVRVYAAAREPQTSSAMNVTLALKNAAVSEISANRSPIGRMTIFFALRTPRIPSVPAHSRT